MEENSNILIKSVLSKENMNDKLKKNKIERNHGIYFIRIIAMYGIVINHIIYQKKTINKYKKFIKN